MHNALPKVAGFIQMSTLWRGLPQCFDFHSLVMAIYAIVHGYKRLGLDLDLDSIYATAQ